MSTSYYETFTIFQFLFFLQRRAAETFKLPLQTLRYKKLKTPLEIIYIEEFGRIPISNNK